MKRGPVYVLMMFFMLFLVSCGTGKQSAIEGKLVDWNDKPIAGVKITASQVQPIKGYEQFEAVTSADGSFRIKGLFPSSAYVLKPWSDKWSCETEIKIETAPQGETAVLPLPMIVDQIFTKSEPVLVADIATGNAAQSVIEGKLFDLNGKPVVGVSMIAIQKQPIEGYEKFEVVTKDNGTFHFPKLLASSEYIIKPVSNKWVTDTAVKVKTPKHHGETAVLPSPMVIERAYSASGGSLVIDLATGKIRFTVSTDGVIIDSQTNLEWIVGPDQNTRYDQAVAWVAGLSVAGGGWKMPTTVELQTLYQKGDWPKKLGQLLDTSFKFTGKYVWAEPRDSSSTWLFDFAHGELYLYPPARYLHRVFAVRPQLH